MHSPHYTSGKAPAAKYTSNRTYFRPTQQKFLRLYRCHAGGRRDPNSFNPLLWGQNMMKKLNKVEAESTDASETSNAESVPESTQQIQNRAIQHPEIDEIDEALNAELDRRRKDFRHLVFCGRDVTMEYPENGTPTWDQWQKVIEESKEKQWRIWQLERTLNTAISEEDYFTAAELKKDLDAVKAEDVVENFLQDYKMAVRDEDFSKAAELLEGCSIDLCGWWSVNTPTNENVPHLLRVDKAFNKYIFQAFAPDRLAEMHGTSAVAGEQEPFIPETEDFEIQGCPLAELHFQQFPCPEEESGQRIYTLATVLPGAASALAKLPKTKNGDPIPFPTYDKSGKLEQTEATARMSSDHLMTAITEGIIEASDKLIEEEGLDEALISFDRQIEAKIKQKEEEQKQEEKKEEEDSKLAAQSSTEITKTDTAPDFLKRNVDSYFALRPLNLLRTDKDRIMLIPSLNTEIQLDRDSNGSGIEFSENPEKDSNDEPDTETSKRVSVISIDGKSSAKEIAAKLKDVLSGNLPKGESKSLLDEAEKNFRRQMEEQDEKDEKDSNSAEVKKPSRGMMKQLAKHVKALLKATTTGQEVLERRGLQGAVGYSRLEIPTSTTDPFSGLFIGMFGAHGPEIISCRRVIGQDGKEYIEGTKITGDANVPAGQLSFRAGIGRDNKIASTRYLPPELGIRARYKGEGQIATTGFQNPRWVDGELWHLSSSNMLGQSAEIGFLYTIGDNKILTPLNRLHLDDPLQNLTK